MEKGLSLSVIQPHFCEAIFTCKITEMRSSAVNWKSIWKYPQSEVKFLNQASFKIYRKNWFFLCLLTFSHTHISRHGKVKFQISQQIQSSMRRKKRHFTLFECQNDKERMYLVEWWQGGGVFSSIFITKISFLTKQWPSLEFHFNPLNMA